MWLNDQKGGDFGRSVNHFSAPNVSKNGNLWKIEGKIRISGSIFGATGAEIFLEILMF